jgi:membrane-associated phospholipid phosphatase
MTQAGVLIDGFVRAYPMFIVIYSLMEGLLNNNEKNLLLGVILLISDFFNQFLKNYIFLPLIGKENKIPIFGYGRRPKNSKNSGLFKDGSMATSYGMPSGHAQISWLFTTYWILKIRNNQQRSDISKIVSITILVFLASMVTYSRVYWAKCHTIQQILIGMVVGIILGYIVYDFLNIEKRQKRH